MKSLTKYDVTNEQVRAAFYAAGIGEITHIKDLADGWYNRVLSVLDKNGKRYVIKIAPHKETRVLSLEKNLMESELNFYSILKEKTAIKTPQILFRDFTEKIIPTAYFIMDFLSGERLDKAKLSPAEKQKVSEQWAWILSELHKVKGVGYGYDQTGLSKNWQAALTQMTQNLIDDAASFGKKCKVGQKLLSYIERFSGELENVPCVLVNFDLFSKNMFYESKDNDQIELAIYDLERSFWGDPVGDFIYPEFIKQFGKKTIVEHYNRYAAEPIKLDKNSQIRYHLLSAYLAVIMYTERFSRFRGLVKLFNPIYLFTTLTYKVSARRAFFKLKKLL